MSAPVTGFDSAIHRAEDAGHRDLAKRLKMERRICTALVGSCLRRGYLISVHDSEEWVVKKSTDKAEILAALASTDSDTIRIRDVLGMSAGSFELIYGNDGWDVVADYTDNEVCNAIWEQVIEPLSDKLCLEAA